jgi:hypothetical protein
MFDWRQRMRDICTFSGWLDSRVTATMQAVLEILDKRHGVTCLDVQIWNEGLNAAFVYKGYRMRMRIPRPAEPETWSGFYIHDLPRTETPEQLAERFCAFVLQQWDSSIRDGDVLKHEPSALVSRVGADQRQGEE